MKKMNKKGFTLAELLIVVAIIAVLVAVAIPVFTGSLERAKQATDAANIRAAYAEAVTNMLDKGAEAGSAETKNPMKSDKWDKLTDATKLGTTDITSITKTIDKTILVSVSEGGESFGAGA